MIGATEPRRFGILVYVRTMLVFTAFWALVAVWTSNTVLLPSPRAVFEALVELAKDLELFKHTAISLARMLISLSLACLARGAARAVDGPEPQAR